MLSAAACCLLPMAGFCACAAFVCTAPWPLWRASAQRIAAAQHMCPPFLPPSLLWCCSGRSEGTAEVIYEQAADAERAMRRYNTVQLDGQPMEVRLSTAGAEVDGHSGPANSIAGREAVLC